MSNRLILEMDGNPVIAISFEKLVVLHTALLSSVSSKALLLIDSPTYWVVPDLDEKIFGHSVSHRF